MSVSARMRCHHIEVQRKHDGSVQSKTVYMSPVYDADPNSPNYSFSQASPSGQFTLNITNPAAYEQFEVNGTYDLAFSLFLAPPSAS